MFVPSDEVGADGVSHEERSVGPALFSQLGDDDLLALYTREDALDGATAAAWASALGRRRELFASDGIAYQTLVVPEAPAVYRDLLPDGLQLAARTPFQQLREALDEGTRAQCVYPLDELVTGRARKDTFSAAESAWTGWGAWLGYRASLAALAPAVPSAKVLDENDVTWSERPAGDVLVPTASVRRPRARLGSSVSTETGETLVVMEQDAPELPTAVVFRDWYMDAAAKFYSESFRRVVFVSTPNLVFGDLVAAENPDVVIHELAERRLLLPPAESSTLDFRSVFGDLMLDDGVAVADERRSRSLASAGRFDEAMAASDDVLARVRPNARVMVNRARLHLAAGRSEAAMEALWHAATLDPEDGLVWSILGQLLMQVPGREPRAASAHARAARAEPDQPTYWQLAISAALRADDQQLAEELRREATALHPEDPRVAHAASWALAAAGRLEEAERAAEVAARRQPGSLDSLRLLASIQIRRGHFDEADRTVTRIWQILPDDPEIQQYRDVLRRLTAAATATMEDHHEGER